MSKKIDTRSLGLDSGLNFIHWLTGAENLHYGIWDELEVSAGNLRAAQDAYTTLLFKQLPKGKLRILDIGGGAGVTAAKLLALGHSVDIVIPSKLLAERCRINAPGATVHHCTFEDFTADRRFDLCLFSESFQYIGLGVGMSKAHSLLDAGGEILIADCFRSDAFNADRGGITGGGHPIRLFREALAELPLDVLTEQDITASVAPSIDLEQGLFNVIGRTATRVDDEVRDKRPWSHWFMHRVLRTLMSERKRFRLNRRLNEQTRTSKAFTTFNHYLILRLTRR